MKACWFWTVLSISCRQINIMTVTKMLLLEITWLYQSFLGFLMKSTGWREIWKNIKSWVDLGAEFSSRSFALKSSWKSYEITLLFKKRYWVKRSSFEEIMAMFLLKQWCFHIKKLTFLEPENQSKRKKEPQIPCPNAH